jgi:hypothetical protein
LFHSVNGHAVPLNGDAFRQHAEMPGITLLNVGNSTIQSFL